MSFEQHRAELRHQLASYRRGARLHRAGIDVTGAEIGSLRQEISALDDAIAHKPLGCPGHRAGHR